MCRCWDADAGAGAGAADGMPVLVMPMRAVQDDAGGAGDADAGDAGAGDVADASSDTVLTSMSSAQDAIAIIDAAISSCQLIEQHLVPLQTGYLVL